MQPYSGPLPAAVGGVHAWGCGDNVIGGAACAGPAPPRFSRQVSMDLPMPFEGRAAQARALWAGGDAYNPMLVNPPVVDYTYAAAALNTVAVPDASRLGGIMPEIIPLPYFQPGTATLRQPHVNGDTAAGLVSAAAVSHGPSLFDYTAADVRPAPQYAPIGDILAEPITWDVVPPGQKCGCLCVVPGSMGEMFVEKYNVCKIRQMLVETGLVQLTPALAALDYTNACACQIAGGKDGGFPAIAAMAWSYMDTPAALQMSPATLLNFLNTNYIARVLATLREEVRLAARYNHKLAEGPRAYLQPYTPVDYNGGSDDCDSSALPATLPGTGCTVIASDSYATTYALTTPLASRRNVEELSTAMGMPIGDFTPKVVPYATWNKFK